VAGTPKRAQPVTGLASWRRLSEPSKDARHRALYALSLMRGDGQSLSTAASAAGTTPATTRRYAGNALTREGTRWRPTKSDRLYRRMVVTGPDGRAEVDVRGSGKATLVARHSNAIRAYLASGDPAVLEPFDGREVGGVRLLADPDLIEELYQRRELDLDDIYPRT
jgi:hypothetical protein